MANLTENPVWEAGIYQWETTDPVLGGPDGIDNVPTRQLGNRTAWLKAQVESLFSSIGGLATSTAVQALINSLDYKQSVRAATTANITLSGVQTIDGVSLLVGDRVLVKDQTVASQNGIYVVSGSAWSRAADADADAEITPGLTVYVEAGTKQGKTRWQVTTPAPIVLGTTLVTFAVVPVGIQANGLRSMDLSTATINLTSDDAGSVIAITGSGGGTLVLPAANSVMAGEMIGVRANNTSVSTNTLKGAGADTIGGASGNGANSFIIQPMDSLVLISDGASKWDVVSESTAAFVARLFTNQQSITPSGYQKLPGGLVVQWGAIVVANGVSGVDVALPTSFASGTLQAFASSSNSNTSASILSATKTSVKLQHSAAGPVGINYLAIGY